MVLCGGSSCAADKVSDEEVSMHNRVFVIVFVVMLVVPQSGFGQTTGAAGLQRMPDGRPDLQGLGRLPRLHHWNGHQSIPVENS